MLTRTKVFGLTIAALLVLTLVPGAPFGLAQDRQGRPTTAALPEPLNILSNTEATEAHFSDFSAPSASSAVQDPLTPLSPGTTTRVSVASDGSQGNSNSYYPSISADGRYAAFHSDASNLVSGDTNGEEDVFVHDRQTGQTTRVSVASDGSQGNDDSGCLSISADGRYAAFHSDASNLVSGDTNDARDIFVHNRQTGQTARVSIASDGSQGNDDSSYTYTHRSRPSISTDGRYVVFQSWASNLVSGDTNSKADVFVHDQQTGQATRVSMASDGTQGNSNSYYPSISADGRYVAFDSYASNLVTGDTNSKWDIFVHDRQTGQTTRVSVASDGSQGNSDSYYPSISANGRYVAFRSDASNLVSGDTNDERDVFVHDRQTGQTTRVSIASDGSQGNSDSWSPSISADGRYVAFQSGASNLVSGDTNGRCDIFVHDRQTGQTARVSMASDGTQGNSDSFYPSISADGRYVVFQSWASNLVSGDTNSMRDVFVHDRGGGGDTTPPATITDLAASTGTGAGEVDLTWTAPGDDGDTGTAMTYTVRYADSAIVSPFGWVMATDVSGEPTPQAAGSYESMTVSGLTPGQTYHFAIRTQDEAANWSGLSNSPSAVAKEALDIGFRPNPDGYSFSNGDPGWGRYPLPPANSDYTMENMRRMFGDAAVCHTVEGACIPRPNALLWNISVNRMMNGGHCDGFTTTSLRFFRDLDNPADFQSGANITHDLQLDNVRRHIAYYWVLVVPNPVAEARNQALQNTPSQVLNQLRSAMSDGATDPTTLLVYNADRTSGHTVTPYAIEDRGDGVYWVRVYDNNDPDNTNRYVEINTTNDTWSSNLIGSVGTWSGDADSSSLGSIAISTYAQQPECPWCDETGALSASQARQTQTWLGGQGHLLISDSQGRRIGYVGDQFVNEVPGAFGSVPPGGLGVPGEPIYYLPLTDTYTILLDGQTLTQTDTVAVTQFGPGYAVSMDDVTLEPTSQDRVIIAPDGTQLAYQPNDDKEATLTLALDGASESNQLQVKGTDIGAGQVVTLTADVDNGQLLFNNAQAGGGEYNLDVRLVSAAGEQWFVHAGLVISATDTHYVDYGAWDGSGPMTLHVDQGSDGTIDETLELENQVSRVYLPLILRTR